MTPATQPPTRVASLDDFRAALLAAHGALCAGSMGAGVREGETWEGALSRESAAFLATERLGRPKGPVPDAWAEAIRAVASQRSTAPDGCVRLASGLRVPLRSVPRAPVE